MKPPFHGLHLFPPLKFFYQHRRSQRHCLGRSIHFVNGEKSELSSDQEWRLAFPLPARFLEGRRSSRSEVQTATNQPESAVDTSNFCTTIVSEAEVCLEILSLSIQVQTRRNHSSEDNFSFSGVSKTFLTLEVF